jgi:hypothetical protein
MLKLVVLRKHLLEHGLRTGRSDGLVFGADGSAPRTGRSLPAQSAYGGMGAKADRTSRVPAHLRKRS